jgi:hypothetical protein
LAPRSPHLLEKTFEGFSFSIFDNGNESLGLILDLVNESHVVVALGVCDLVNANGLDALKIPMFETIVDNPFDRVADIIPRGIEAGSGFFPAEASRPCGEKMTKDITARKLAVGPRDFFSFDAASGTLDSTHGVRNRDGDVPKRDKLKEPWIFGCVVTRSSFTAAPTARATIGTRSYLCNNMRRFTHGV